MRGFRFLPFVLSLAAALWLPVPAAHARPDPANHAWKVTGTPFPDVTPNDCHITFTGTGGTIKNVTYTMGPAIASIGVSGGNTIDIVWKHNLPVGTVFMFEFTTTHPEIGIAGGTWTKDGQVIRNIIIAQAGVPPSELTIEEIPLGAIPTVSQWGLIALGLLLLSAGTAAAVRLRAGALVRWSGTD